VVGRDTWSDVQTVITTLPRVACSDVAEGVGCCAQPVGAVDDRGELPCLEPTGECAQVLALLDGSERLQRLAGDQRSHASLDEPAQRADPASTSAAVGDERAGRCQSVSHRLQRLRFHVVEDDVVAPSRLGEVRSRVVDDVGGAQGPDELHVAGAAHPGHLCPQRLGDLHGERPDAA